MVTFTISSLLLIVAYLLGSIPTGYLMGKFRGIDIREHGSGSIGATNVLRTLGKTEAIAVLLIDLLKGASAVAIVYGLFAFAPSSFVPKTWQPWLVTANALAALVGHSKSIWINFAGGKSVATGLGVLLVINFWVALATLATFVVVLAISRIVSVSSIAGAIAVNVLMLGLKQPLPYVLFSAIAGAYVIWRHRSNVERLLAGTEPKIGQKLPQEQAQSLNNG